MASVVPLSSQAGAARGDRILQGLLRLPREPRLSALIFHRVLPEADPLRPSEPVAIDFEARMRWVAANFDVLPLSEAAQALAQSRLPRRALCITFDDGYADNHDIALPILQRLGVPATFFIATGYLDGGCMFNDVVIEAVRAARAPTLDLGALSLGIYPVGNDVERSQAIGGILGRLKYMEPGRRQELALEIAQRVGARVPSDLMMTSEQVAKMHASGMEIGAHTVSHPILAEHALDAARNEIAEGRKRLEQITGVPVRVFAYPNGKPVRDYRQEHVTLVRDLGFECAVSTAWGAARSGADLHQIPRFTPWDRDDLRYGLRLIGNLWRSDYEVA
jgi:peptidoglycan/xylan/chitin deacetylase (PgdA/CDA1 family)